LALASPGHPRSERLRRSEVAVEEPVGLVHNGNARFRENGQSQREMATAAPEAGHTASGVLGGPAGARVSGHRVC
jgi:hypothetical protein